MVFRKLKRVWSNNDMNYIPNFRETFPELNKLSTEEVRNRWVALGIHFYTQKKTPVKPCIRFTLPFAVLLLILMFISLPVLFLSTGRWGYGFTKRNCIYNWFRALGMVE